MARLLGVVMVVLTLVLTGPLSASVALAAGPIITVDGPSDSTVLRDSSTVLGWAADRAAARGTGVDAVHVYLDGVAGRGRMLGSADYGLVRNDVASALGHQRFAPSGFRYGFDLGSIGKGEHTLFVYARSQQVGWKHVTIKVIIETTAAAPPPPAGNFLGTPPGLPVAGQYSYGNVLNAAPNYTYTQPPSAPYSPGAPPPPPGATAAYTSDPSVSPAWSVAQSMSNLGGAPIRFDDAQYLGVGQSSRANLYALMLSGDSMPAWQGQSGDVQYDWTLQTARQLAGLHQNQPVAFMLLSVTIDGYPAPGDNRWLITLGPGPQPGTWQNANVLAFGMHRPGQGYQIELRP